MIIRKEVLELLQGKQDGQDLECACHIYYYYVPGRTRVVTTSCKDDYYIRIKCDIDILEHTC